MLKQTNYGLWVDDDGEKNENEKAIDYIVECAKSVGIEVVPGETALSVCFIAEVLKGIKAQEQKWIPVSERLPEDFGTYLITLKNREICLCDINPEDFGDRAELSITAVAWMPFKPYKEE